MSKNIYLQFLLCWIGEVNYLEFICSNVDIAHQLWCELKVSSVSELDELLQRFLLEAATQFVHNLHKKRYHTCSNIENKHILLYYLLWAQWFHFSQRNSFQCCCKQSCSRLIIIALMSWCSSRYLVFPCSLAVVVSCEEFIEIRRRTGQDRAVGVDLSCTHLQSKNSTITQTILWIYCVTIFFFT